VTLINTFCFSRIIHPVKYFRDYLKQDVRPDGRQFLQFRTLAINADSIGTADGSAIVKVGNTTVVCGIKAVSCGLEICSILSLLFLDRFFRNYVNPKPPLPTKVILYQTLSSHRSAHQNIDRERPVKTLK
jgi:3' exoribonuclease family, domain 1